MPIELKPCPFCGREPAVADITGGTNACWVDCYKCETSGPVVAGGDLSGAAAAWNIRQGDAATARAEAAEQRAEAAEAQVERMFEAARKVANRFVRDAEDARKRRLDWSEAAGCEAEVAKSMLRALEQAAKAEAKPAGEVSDG